MVNHKNTHIILIQTFDFFLIINLLRKKAAARKRIAYTARQKALYDYNTLMEESFERGVEQTKREMIIKFYKKGESPEQLADDFEVPLEQVNIIIKDIKNE